MDMVANNLANMNTTAYKGDKLMFVQHLIKSRGSESFIPDKLAFTRDVAEYRNFADGPIRSTGNSLDVAIKGEGYLVVETDNGDRYTRAGQLQLSPDGQLVTDDGHPVLSDAGAPFFFGPTDTDIEIARDGTLSTNNGVLGKIRLVRFDKAQELTPEGGQLWNTDQTPINVENPEIIQGSLEDSNVQPILELTRMIDVHRAYDQVRTFIDQEDQRQRKLLEATKEA